jgi:hypothetical protein
LFVPILSERYFTSVWCAQESGIAAVREMTIIPLSVDGTLPLGFMAHIQSTKINGDNPTFANMTAKIREEDRMEAALPGLREAADLLVPLLSELRWLEGKENADQIIGACFNSPTESFSALARRSLPNADERMRREVAGMILLLRMTSQQLANAYRERERASRDLADISNFGPPITTRCATS